MNKAILYLALLYCVNSLAILPLPYPVEPIEEIDSANDDIERDPRNIQGYSELYSGSQLRAMELPKFDNPPNTLGYVKGKTFTVPPGLRARVDFWEKIYSKFTSSQIAIHDSKHLNVIYNVIDVSHIISNPRWSSRRKRRAINRLINKEKRTLKRKLLALDAYRDDPAEMPIELFPIFKKFESINEKNKFLNAATRVRGQTGQRNRIVEGFFYGGRYFNKMIEIFEEEGVPKELTRLTLVESAFNIRARSKVGASGVWQFTRATGKRFLRIDRGIDERNDPLKATRAAARLLKKNYQRLKVWPLAITAYNHGREGMARAVASLGTDDIEVIIAKYKSRTFGFASSNFYTEFLAILEMERDYRKYFGKLMVDSPISFETIQINRRLSLARVAKACGLKSKELQNYNLAFTKHITSGRGKIPKGYPIQVPNKYASICEKNLEKNRR